MTIGLRDPSRDSALPFQRILAFALLVQISSSTWSPRPHYTEEIRNGKKLRIASYGHPLSGTQFVSGLPGSTTSPILSLFTATALKAPQSGDPLLSVLPNQLPETTDPLQNRSQAGTPCCQLHGTLCTKLLAPVAS